MTTLSRRSVLAATPSLRFSASDAQAANETWGCNCGPGALAAVLGLTLDEVRPLLQGFEAKRYMNPTMMWDALARSGRRWHRMRPPLTWPTHGLARIQWHGPWMDDGVPIKARYRHTHWVAAQSRPGSIGIFDINAMSSGGWIALKDCGTVLVPWLISEAVPRGNGQWSITHVVEVSP